MKLWLVFIATAALLANGCSTPSGQQRPVSASKSLPAKGPGTGNPAASRERLDEEIPVEALAHFAAGLTYDLNGQTELAIEEYSQSALANPSHEPVVIEAARRHLRARKPEQAIEILRKATDSASASGSLYAWLGLACGQAGQTEAAIRANRTAIKKLPRSLPAYQNLAQIYFQSSQTNEALRVLDEAAHQASVDAPFLLDLAELYSRYARTQGAPNDAVRERAVKVLDRAAQLDSPNPATWQRLADSYVQLGELGKAEAIFARMVKTYPQLFMLRGKLAELYLRTGKKEQAAEQLEAIAQLEPTNPRTQAFLGSLALDNHNVEQAIRHFERALALSPDLEQVYYELAGVKIVNQKKPEEGLALLAKARTRFRPGFVMEYYTGLAHVLLKQYREGIQHFTSAELLAKADQPARLTHQFYYQLGSACERNGDSEQAEKHFQKCLEISPDSADAMNYLGYMLTERGTKLEQARILIQRAVELEPNNAAFLDSFGWVLFKLNQPREALTYLHRSIEKSEELDSTLYDHLGDIYRTLDELERAREAWQRALAIEDSRDATSKSLTAEEYGKIKRKLEAAPGSGQSAP
ncbi:MAG: tetratricopeptide repeat protein [Verrucomicrobia bacterium]|nr:tetratricopeptide repeat protein [Verrucomicrobiota bacterium]